MVHFGPSGNDKLFYEQGFKSSVQAPEWLKKLGLNAYEYNFGRGINLSEKTAAAIGAEAKKHEILISAHAPYFINLGSADPEAIRKSYGYIERSLNLLKIMGGRHLVVHIGSQTDLTRTDALANCKKNLAWVVEELTKKGFDGYYLCIETMGRPRAIGNYNEICELCQVAPCVIPTLDFGHINCILHGELTENPDKMHGILKYCLDKLSYEKMRNVHIHFSAVEYTANGERAHTTLDNKKYGIKFEPLARAIKEFKLEPTVICESSEIMAQDALKLFRTFNF